MSFPLGIGFSLPNLIILAGQPMASGFSDMRSGGALTRVRLLLRAQPFQARAMLAGANRQPIRQ
jgi:hypothetical protein